MIAVRRLRVVGVSQNYDVGFLQDGAVRPLSVIAGEISTGKTSILDFVDFCLGASDHPRQVEVQRQGRVALLELELSGPVHVIERPLFSSQSTATLHRCAIDDLEGPHETTAIPLGPASTPKSLNWLLLRHSGLEGVVLKEAPTQADSGTDALSFRDVMWLAYLSDDRLLAGQLLHELTFMRKLKLRQVIEVIFGVHDQQLAAMGDRIKRLEEERAAQQRETEALQTFLREQDVDDRLTLLTQLAQVERDAADADEQLALLEARMQATTDYADAVRRQYGKSRRASARAAAQVRDRDALLRRLLPLRGQYAEDERKLVFFSEARRLFDPLRVTVCPSCLQDLPESPAIEDETCTLCHQRLDPVAEDASIDVEAERAAIRVRLRSLDGYVTEVEEQLHAARTEMQATTAAEEQTRAALDSDLSERLSPFVAERDHLVRQTETTAARLRDLHRQVGWWDAVQRRKGDVEALEERLRQLRDEQRALEAGRPARDSIVADLSGRFEALLRAFGFPKLDDPEPPYLDDEFVPHVRGVSYEQLRSRGATTLVAVAWQLAIFQRAIETGAPHPGFLLIDSPQSGLKPIEARERDEFSSAEIPQRLWDQIRRWTHDAGAGAQQVVVDNLPPSDVDGDIVVRYSGDPGRPPYGFIANETGVSERLAEDDAEPPLSDA